MKKILFPLVLLVLVVLTNGCVSDRGYQQGGYQQGGFRYGIPPAGCEPISNVDDRYGYDQQAPVYQQKRSSWSFLPNLSIAFPLVSGQGGYNGGYHGGGHHDGGYYPPMRPRIVQLPPRHVVLPPIYVPSGGQYRRY